MKSKKQKTKKAGFGLRLTSAILFMLVTLFFVAGAVITIIFEHSNTYMDWVAKRSGYASVNFEESDNPRFDCDKEYDDWSMNIRSSTYDTADTTYVVIRYSVLIEQDYVDEEGNPVYSTDHFQDVYYFVSEDAEAKSATYKSDSGDYLTVYYEDWEDYSLFLEADGWSVDGSQETVIIFSIAAVAMAVVTVLMFVCAYAGKKHKWANVTAIVIGALSCFTIIGLFALIGGILGNKQLNANEPKAQPSLAQPAPAQPVRAEAPTDSASALSAYPVDYESKPTVSKVLDLENAENLILVGESGEAIEFRQLYVNVHEGELYFIAERLNDGEDAGAVVFRVNYDDDNFTAEEDDDICRALWEEYMNAVNSAQYERQNIKRADFKLDLYDANIDESTWKDFKKTASQEELTTIAIGAKYRIAHSRIKNILYALGIILSIAIFWPTGGWSLIGYPVFAFLATKSIRYQDTFSQTYRKLSKENQALVDGFYNSNVGLTILDGFITFATFWLTIPYQAILLLIGTFAPNFVISKNGILVSIPNGFDVGNLGAVGAYYASFNFIDEALASKSSKSQSEPESSPTDDYYKTEEHTYVDSHGYTQTIYTDHGGKDARDAGGHYVGEVSEDKFTPADKHDDE